jgi:acyl-CoA thioesterase
MPSRLAPSVTHPFDSATAIRSLRSGELPFRASASGARAWDIHIHQEWWLSGGPNGGYLAALLLRGMARVAPSGMGGVRSLTVHRVMSGTPGPARLYAVNERNDQHVNAVTGTLEQDGRPIAVAVATFGASSEGPSYEEAIAPAAAMIKSDAASAPGGLEGQGLVPLLPHYDLMPPAVPVDEGHVSVAWIRLAPTQQRPLDALALSAFATAWTPTPQDCASVAPAETMALTIDFSFAGSERGPTQDDCCLAVFRLRSLGGGGFSECGELWSSDGEMLARTRQLGLLAAA